MEIHIDRDIQVPAEQLTGLIAQGFAGVPTDDVEVLVRASPATLRRWVRLCHNPCVCSQPTDFSSEEARGHTAASRGKLTGLDASLHGPARPVTVRPRYAYTGRVRDRHRHGTPQGRRFLVTLRLPADPEAAAERYPRLSRDPRRRDTPSLRIESWREEIVRLAAHEARHVHQHRHGAPRSEADAERWAQARLHDHRRHAARVRRTA